MRLVHCVSDILAFVVILLSVFLVSFFNALSASGNDCIASIRAKIVGGISAEAFMPSEVLTKEGAKAGCGVVFLATGKVGKVAICGVVLVPKILFLSAVQYDHKLVDMLLGNQVASFCVGMRVGICGVVVATTEVVVFVIWGTCVLV